MTDLDPNGLEAAAKALHGGLRTTLRWIDGDIYDFAEIADAAVSAYLAASAPSPSEPIPDYEFAAREEDRIAGAVAAERERIVKLLRERPGWMAGDIADLVERSAPSPSPPEPPTPCPACGGSGDRNGNLRASDPFGTCPGCDGRGIREAVSPSPPEPQDGSIRSAPPSPHGRAGAFKSSPPDLGSPALEFVRWVNGGFVSGQGRKTYNAPGAFLDEIRERSAAILAAEVHERLEDGQVDAPQPRRLPPHRLRATVPAPSGEAEPSSEAVGSLHERKQA